MARDFAKAFYSSKQWRETSAAYMQSKLYICERCGAAASICHLRKHLNERNISNPYITLSWDNLEALCQECHNIEHMRSGNRVSFDSSGNIAEVKDSPEVAEHKKQARLIDELLADLAIERGDIKGY